MKYQDPPKFILLSSLPNYNNITSHYITCICKEVKMTKMELYNQVFLSMFIITIATIYYQTISMLDLFLTFKIQTFLL
jgi:hypothetical protein